MADDPTVIEQKKQTKFLEEIRDIEQKSLEGAEEGAAIAEKRRERNALIKVKLINVLINL